MGSGNRELDAVLGRVSERRRQGGRGPAGEADRVREDRRRMELIGRLIDGGLEGIARARRMRGEMEQELAARDAATSGRGSAGGGDGADRERLRDRGGRQPEREG